IGLEQHRPHEALVERGNRAGEQPVALHRHDLPPSNENQAPSRNYAAVPPTVRPSIFRVGWPTPTGTPWPSLPQVPMPGSSFRSLPIMPTLVSASEPAPISVAPLTGAPSLPSSIT